MDKNLNKIDEIGLEYSKKIKSLKEETEKLKRIYSLYMEQAFEDFKNTLFKYVELCDKYDVYVGIDTTVEYDSSSNFVILILDSIKLSHSPVTSSLYHRHFIPFAEFKNKELQYRDIASFFNYNSEKIDNFEKILQNWNKIKNNIEIQFLDNFEQSILNEFKVSERDNFIIKNKMKAIDK